jgi:integrase
MTDLTCRTSALTRQTAAQSITPAVRSRSRGSAVIMLGPRDSDRRRSGPRLAGREAQALAEHLGWLLMRGRAHSTADKRRRQITRLAAALPVPLLDADAAMLAAWRAGLGAADATVCAYVSHVRGFFTWAVQAGYLPADPAAGIPVPQHGRRLPRPIGETELLAAVENAAARIRPWLVLAGWTGLRAKEIALLRRECVLDNAASPVILVATDATKGHRERIVPLSPFVLAELRAAGIPGGGWMFTRRDGQHGPNAPGIVSKLCNEHLHCCGIAATLHQLRHRFGTQAYRVGRDLRAVQELLGHAHPATTAGYAAYESASAIEAVNGMPMPHWWQPAEPGR